MSQLDGRTIVITGAAGGLGSLVSQLVRERGARVVGIDRVADTSGGESIVADLADPAAVEAIAHDLAGRQVDVLANVAGVQYFGPLDTQGSERLRLGYAVNLLAPAILAAAVIPQMKARRDGQIVNIGSMMGAVPYPFFSAYSSAKAGLKGLSQALRRELAGTGITVTHVAPRAVRTPLNTEEIRRFMAATGMNADDPERVAARIVAAIERRERDVAIGLSERIFSQINAALPGVIDRGIAAQAAKARALFSS